MSAIQIVTHIYKFFNTCLRNTYSKKKETFYCSCITREVMLYHTIFQNFLSKFTTTVCRICSNHRVPYDFLTRVLRFYGFTANTVVVVVIVVIVLSIFHRSSISLAFPGKIKKWFSFQRFSRVVTLYKNTVLYDVCLSDTRAYYNIVITISIF